MHSGAGRAPLVSEGASLGVYGARPPCVCAECAELLTYAEQRRANCPKDPKPFCSYCDTHCYKPAMREQMRDVMRYAGPRSLLSGHAIEERETLPFDHDAVEEHMAEQPKTYIAQACFNCGASEDDRPLLPVRTKG